MKITLSLSCALLFTVVSAFADSKEYQATGPVTAMTDTTITVQKGKELWEVSKDANTKMTGDAPKVGDKVTVHYMMVASSIENKGAAPAKAPKTTKAAAAPAAGAGDNAAKPAAAAAASPAKP